MKFLRHNLSPSRPLHNYLKQQQKTNNFREKDHSPLSAYSYCSIINIPNKGSTKTTYLKISTIPDQKLSWNFLTKDYKHYLHNKIIERDRETLELVPVITLLTLIMLSLIYSISTYSTYNHLMVLLNALLILTIMSTIIYPIINDAKDHLLNVTPKEELVQIPTQSSKTLQNIINHIPTHSRLTLINLIKEKNFTETLDENWINLLEKLYQKDPNYPTNLIPSDSNKLRKIIHRLEEIELEELRLKKESSKPIREQVTANRELEDTAIMEGVKHYLNTTPKDNPQYPRPHGPNNQKPEN